MKTFEQAEAHLNGGRDKSYRPLPGVATFMHRIDADTIAVQYHATDVVTYHRDGTYTICAGGWRSNTTRDRINTYSPARAYFEKGELFISGTRRGPYVDTDSPWPACFPERRFGFSTRMPHSEPLDLDKDGLPVRELQATT